MSTLIEEYRKRRGLLKGLNHTEARVRLGGFYEWLNKTEETREIVDDVLNKVDVEAMLANADRVHPPLASSLEEIIAVGLLVMKKTMEGMEPAVIAIEKGIHPAYREAHERQDYLDELLHRYIEPALNHIENVLAEREQLSSALPGRINNELGYPLEVTESLKHFFRDHPEYRRNAFLMMRFSDTRLHKEIIEGIRKTLQKYGMEGLRADDKQYHDDLFPNVQTYMHGCRFGIAVFERLLTDEFNPNVSLEVGYMRALHKPVCLLKDNTLKLLQTDLMGKLYRSFDPQDPLGSIPLELDNWLRDKEIITL